MPKPFKTYYEQIRILQSRGLKIEDEEKAIDILSKVNYYNLINGYKAPFLKKDLKGKIKDPERYTSNTKFEEIYAVYEMDRKIKAVLMEYLLIFENIIKSLCAYKFSQRYKSDYAYLHIDSYSKDTEKLDKVLGTISMLSKEITRNNKKDVNRKYVHHYIQNHGNIPLWVLVNLLSIGNISYFYSSLDDSLRGIIAEDLKKTHNKDYLSKKNINSGHIDEVLKIVNFFRNVCAHDEVLLFFELYKGIKTKLFKSLIGISYITGKKLFDLICALKVILPKSRYKEMLDKIKEIFEESKDSFKSIKFQEIVDLAGFKETWYEDLNG